MGPLNTTSGQLSPLIPAACDICCCISPSIRTLTCSVLAFTAACDICCCISPSIRTLTCSVLAFTAACDICCCISPSIRTLTCSVLAFTAACDICCCISPSIRMLTCSVLAFTVACISGRSLALREPHCLHCSNHSVVPIALSGLHLKRELLTECFSK